MVTRNPLSPAATAARSANAFALWNASRPAIFNGSSPLDLRQLDRKNMPRIWIALSTAVGGFLMINSGPPVGDHLLLQRMYPTRCGGTAGLGSRSRGRAIPTLSLQSKDATVSGS